MNLLCRFYDTTSGEVLVDGINVKDLDLYELRDNIGMAMQDVFLFPIRLKETLPMPSRTALLKR